MWNATMNQPVQTPKPTRQHAQTTCGKQSIALLHLSDMHRFNGRVYVLKWGFCEQKGDESCSNTLSMWFMTMIEKKKSHANGRAYLRV